MNEAVTLLLSIFGGFFFIVISTIFIINVATKGFLMKYIQAKSSKGKKILVIGRTISDRYFTTAEFVDMTIVKYTSRSKQKKTIDNVTTDSIFDFLGVKTVEIDELNNAIIKPTGVQIPGSNVSNADLYIERVIKMPQKKTNDTLINLILLIIVCLLCMFIAYQVYQNHGLLMLIIEKATVI